MKLFENEIPLLDEHFVDDKKEWNTSTLIRAAKDMEPYDLQISAIDLAVRPFKVDSFYQFLYQVSRMNDADLSYPVIQTPTGYICNGWHRLARAILRGDETIKAVRLKQMPDADEILKD